MNLLQALILGILQGATEFLPVSSSGHLVLVPWLLGWDPPGLAFDAILHLGTAVAVVAYFWRDWVRLLRAVLVSLRRLRGEPPVQALLADLQARLFWFLVLGSLPAAILGVLLEGFFEEMFAQPVAVSVFLLCTAGILTTSEWLHRRDNDLDALSWRDALLIGSAQAVAILPGISRSGATIAAGLLRGIKRESAARFSFLLATPAILGAGLLKTLDLMQAGSLVAQAPALVVGFAAAGLIGWGCIHFLLRYLQSHRLYPFAIYCTVAGLACLLVALFRGG